ncbi:MAG: (2Fe-2S)-binding protein [Planctomycetota bacterium]
MRDSIQRVQLTVNGVRHEAEVSTTTRLVDFLQDELGLTGTKFCCGIGVCRACTVASRNAPEAPRVPMLSCSTPVAAVDGYEIDTVEGLGSAEDLSPLQRAFLEHFSFQCGYCTPGFLMAATLLIERLQNDPVAEDEIDAAIAEACGEHICRCTGYVRYYEAMRAVIQATPGATK